jgi:hypothetical protein
MAVLTHSCAELLKRLASLLRAGARLAGNGVLFSFSSCSECTVAGPLAIRCVGIYSDESEDRRCVEPSWSDMLNQV